MENRAARLHTAWFHAQSSARTRPRAETRAPDTAPAAKASSGLTRAGPPRGGGAAHTAGNRAADLTAGHTRGRPSTSSVSFNSVSPRRWGKPGSRRGRCVASALSPLGGLSPGAPGLPTLGMCTRSSGSQLPRACAGPSPELPAAGGGSWLPTALNRSKWVGRGLIFILLS